MPQPNKPIPEHAHKDPDNIWFYVWGKK